MAKSIGFPVRISDLPKDDPRYIKWLESLKKRPPPWNKGYTKESHPSILKMSNTFRTKKIDNFSIWRQQAKENGLIQGSYLPLERNSHLAFITGLILGDGNIYKFPRTECLRIVLGTDKPMLIEYAAKIMKMVFNKNPTIRIRKSSACADLCIYQSHLSERLGISSGARGALVIKLPSWIWRNKKYLVSCLRGLFEAEGSYSVHLRTYTYNLSFSNHNISLLDEVENALIKLGFHPERRYNSVRLRKKLETIAFIELSRFRQFD